MKTETIASVHDWRDFAERWVQETKSSLVTVLLVDGPMGAGKTTLAGELALALGSKDQTGSPTYALESEYHFANGRMLHWDLYRIGSWDELESTGFSDRVASLASHRTDRVVLVVEWAERLKELTWQWPSGLEVEEIQLTVDANQQRRIKRRRLAST
jgi:tRNA threonylcarbamoyl adenosine modification protein YjeE